MMLKQSTRRLATLAAMLAGVTTITGCNHSAFEEYTSRQEGISSHAGDAIAYNAANQTVDPWPDNFDDTNISTDGKRQADAVKRYRAANEPPALIPLTPTTTSAAPPS